MYKHVYRCVCVLDIPTQTQMLNNVSTLRSALTITPRLELAAPARRIGVDIALNYQKTISAGALVDNMRSALNNLFSSSSSSGSAASNSSGLSDLADLSGGSSGLDSITAKLQDSLTAFANSLQIGGKLITTIRAGKQACSVLLCAHPQTCAPPTHRCMGQHDWQQYHHHPVLLHRHARRWHVCLPACFGPLQLRSNQHWRSYFLGKCMGGACGVGYSGDTNMRYVVCRSPMPRGTSQSRPRATLRPSTKPAPGRHSPWPPSGRKWPSPVPCTSIPRSTSTYVGTL